MESLVDFSRGRTQDKERMNELSKSENIAVGKDEKLAPQELHLAVNNENSTPEAQFINPEPALSVESVRQESENCASVDLAIQSNALSVSLRSRASLNPDVIALNAQVRLLTEQLAEAQLKIDEANYKVGFLEAQLLGLREKRQKRESEQVSERGREQEPSLEPSLEPSESGRKSIGSLLRILFPGKQED